MSLPRRPLAARARAGPRAPLVERRNLGPRQTDANAAVTLFPFAHSKLPHVL
jgi:hypothetical protein